MRKNLGTNRSCALEEAYFRREDARKIAHLRANNRPQDPLGAALGVHDPVVIKRLSELGIVAEVAPALRLLPLFAVAWSDGRLDPLEVRELFAEADTAGITERSASHALLESWVRNKPSVDFQEAWEIYVRSLSDELGERAMEAVRDLLLRRARRVAQASGGLLGFGAVSRCEQRALDALGDALAK